MKKNKEANIIKFQLNMEGHCSRCGLCCLYPGYDAGFNDENGICTKLIYETKDGELNYSCALQFNKPIGCLKWPETEEDLATIPECTFKIIK